MKKILLSIICFLACIFSLQAQTLYGTTNNGGNDGGGTINRFVPGTNNLTVAQSFESLATNPFHTNFIQASDGKLYGMTLGGGITGAGVIFSFDPSSSTYTKVMDFDKTNGANPYGSLMQGSDGKLYGMTSGGGSGGVGVIFSFDLSSSTYTKVVDFDRTNGANPYGSLIQAKDGKLYGMTYVGGSSGYGVIFSFDPSTFTYTKLKDFDNTIGAYPRGSLIQASDGKLYAMTRQGGSSGVGVIFSFDPLTSTYTKLKDFDYTNGDSPNGNLIQGSDRKLYGATTNGGSRSYGVIFSFDPLASIYTKLTDFDNTNGAHPRGSLMQASDGKLYGMANSGVSGGVIFSYDPSSSTYTKLKDFGINENGSNVSGSLVEARDGKLYGMSSHGGNSGHGIIFSFNPSTFTYTKLKDFDNTNGAYPYGTLMQASDGNLYGMTAEGGSSAYGVIFSFDPSASIYTKLKDFDNTSGGYPHGSLIQARDGKLYGMTQVGGSSGYGVIFSFDPSSSTYTNLKNFDGANGGYPFGNLMQASDRKLYGMTHRGGSSNAGVIFSFDPSSSIYAHLKDFDYTNGAHPFGSLIQASNEKLYGMASGGSGIDGVIFSFDPFSSTYTKLKDFDNTDGANPYGSLLQASDGKLYGMTNRGGSNNVGVIFSYDPIFSTYTKLQDYNGVNGAHPYFGAAFIEVHDVEKKPPAVSFTIPYNIVKYTGPARIKLNAIATDEDGTITKVRFYNGAELLHTETVFPYGFLWDNVPVGNYTLTAKATDNNGNVTTANTINVSVVDENVSPVVSIISPVDKTTYTGPATIHLIAKAKDPNDRISKVEFYNGTTLIITKHYYPYSYTWRNVQPGNYTLTAKAFDDKGLSATSDPVIVTVTASNELMVNRKPFASSKTNLNGVSLELSPNPSRNSLSIYTNGLQQSKKLNISVVSVSGVVVKSIQETSKQIMQIDVSSLRPGVYILKILSGDKVLYTQFVKL